MKNIELNKIKVALVDKGKTNKWLAEKLERNSVTVSRWCRNTQQPHLQDLFTIAAMLEVNVCTLLVKENPFDKEGKEIASEQEQVEKKSPFVEDKPQNTSPIK